MENDPLNNFLQAYLTHEYEVFRFIISVMLGVTMIYIAIKFLCDIVEFELDRMLKKYFTFRQRKDNIKL
jgi:hypothetical protein